MQHIHLDPLGGIAGDMFVAAMLECFPEHREEVIVAAQSLSGTVCQRLDHHDGILAGARFLVDEHGHHHHDHHHHHHTHWREIRGRIETSDLPPAARTHAIGIFACLAEAEARVHGVAVDDVAFHEVGAADSIADIVAAATLIAAIGPASWSIAALPIGSGRIATAHGLMPVPAPATALLLEGLATHDDGVPGERVTPTGAAILRHLGCRSDARPPGTLRRSGFGFGTRRLPGVSNCLRVLVFDAPSQAISAGVATGFMAGAGHRELAVVSFEVDDQSGEELGAGLDRLRAVPGVHDVIQMAAYGKKGRFAVHVQVLARPETLDDVIAACFRETTTIGLRTQIVRGHVLQRRFAEVPVGGHTVRVKLVERPDGPSGKAEADDVRDIVGHAARAQLRRTAERLAEGGGRPQDRGETGPE
jgi:uncharacterized protein (TIGR00299 family) protein